MVAVAKNVLSSVMTVPSGFISFPPSNEVISGVHNNVMTVIAIILRIDPKTLLFICVISFAIEMIYGPYN
jgi:hypothetical protein